MKINEDIIDYMKNLKEFEFSKILKKIKLSREPLYRQLQDLVDENILNKRKESNIFLYSINIENKKAVNIIGLVNSKTLEKDSNRYMIEKIIEKGVDKSTMFILYRKIKNKKFEIILVCSHNKKDNQEKIQGLTKSLECENQADIYASSLLIQEFLDKMNGEYKESILENYTPVFGGERFYFELNNLLSQEPESSS